MDDSAYILLQANILAKFIWSQPYGRPCENRYALDIIHQLLF